jgi:hypothetical protein
MFDLARVAYSEFPRSIYEEARDVARALAKTEAFEQSRRDRKVEAFAERSDIAYGVLGRPAIDEADYRR